MGKDNETTVDTTPWAPMQPHILGAASTIRNVVGSNQGNLDQIASGIRGQLPTLQNMAFGPQPGLSAATNYATDVLGGKYLNGNPYMDNMLAQTRNNVGNQVNSTFSMAGRTGGGNNVQRLTEGLANAENNLRYQDYSAERDRMGQQGSLIPSLTAAQYAGVSPWLSAAQTAGNLPYAGIGALGPVLGQGSSAGQSTQQGPNNTLGNLLGGIGAALPFIFPSDRRLKKDIVEVGTHRSGLTEYEWTYRNDPEGRRYRGVMADEVRVKRPEAYVENYLDTGFAAVNYGAL